MYIFLGINKGINFLILSIYQELKMVVSDVVITNVTEQHRSVFGRDGRETC